jgi:hypothetical protein
MQKPEPWWPWLAEETYTSQSTSYFLSKYRHIEAPDLDSYLLRDTLQQVGLDGLSCGYFFVDELQFELDGHGA